jgi:hypothetical protein
MVDEEDKDRVDLLQLPPPQPQVALVGEIVRSRAKILE